MKTLGKALILLIVVALVAVPLAACQGQQEPAGPETVTFPDANLEAAIRDALGKPAGEPITKAELAELTELVAAPSDIADLSGLEYCTSLTGLWLADNQISDISPLENLTNLTELTLYNNQISDISPLSNLTSLTGLWLDNNQISDISPLENLTNLTEVYLFDNNLDLSEGSEAWAIIITLTERGVFVGL